MGLKMSIAKVPFRKYQLMDIDKQDKPVPIRFNSEEWDIIEDTSQIIQQAKTSTTVKFLMVLGYKCIKEQKSEFMLTTLFKNKKNNERNNITLFE